MPNPLNETNIIAPRVPLIDERSGLIAREWYRFFLNLFVLTGSGRNDTSLLDLQVGPPTQPQIDLHNINPEPAGFAAYAAGTTQESQIAELIKQISGLQTLPVGLESQVAELQKQVEGLQLTPPSRQFKRARYGQFFDTTTQTAALINTPYAITYNTTDISNGVYLGSPSSRIYIDEPAIYNFLFSIQVDKTSGGTANFWVWPRVNGADVPNSASQIRIQGNDAEIFSSVGFFFNLNAGDYVEFMFAVSDTSVELKTFPASAFYPAVPSIIVTVTDNIQGVQ